MEGTRNASKTRRYSHTATLLPNGKVLVVGGYFGSIYVTATAELYDPVTGAWTSTGSLITARASHTATLLKNGKVLVAGGFNYDIGYLASVELYDPASGAWTTTSSLASAAGQRTATLLGNGKVLVAGGGITWMALSRRPSFTIRSAELGLSRASFSPPAAVTGRPCYLTGRCW